LDRIYSHEDDKSHPSLIGFSFSFLHSLLCPSMFTVRETAARGRTSRRLLAAVESADDGGVAAGSLTYMGIYLVVIPLASPSFFRPIAVEGSGARGRIESSSHRVVLLHLCCKLRNSKLFKFT
jgi:hypothetical protein